MNRCLLLATATVLVTLAGCSAKGLSADKLRSSYAKINEYLVKNVESKNPEVNMASLEELLHKKASKCNLLGGQSMVEALKLLSEFATIPADKDACQRAGRRELMVQVDSGLTDESRLRESNYPLSRLDRIIDHYAFKNALRCQEAVFRASLDFGYKHIAYDKIEEYLVKELTEDGSILDNLAKAKEWLASLHPEDGALAEALKQFLMLQDMDTEGSCNQQGYEILFRNDLATRGNAHSYMYNPTRRIDKIFQTYASLHEEICRSVIRRTIGSELKKLDKAAYRSVLGLTSACYLSHTNYRKLAENLDKKKIDEKFTLPEMDDYVADVLKRFEEKSPVRLSKDDSENIDIKDLYNYVKAVSAEDRALNSADGAQKLISKYLIEPCKQYLQVFEGLMEIDAYGRYVHYNHFDTVKEEFADDITYHMVREGTRACKYVAANQKKMLNYFKIMMAQ